MNVVMTGAGALRRGAGHRRVGVVQRRRAARAARPRARRHPPHRRAPAAPARRLGAAAAGVSARPQSLSSWSRRSTATSCASCAALLARPGLELVRLTRFPGAAAPRGDRRDAARERAHQGAGRAARCTGLPAIADDTGLEVDALRRRSPGVHSARFAGSRRDRRRQRAAAARASCAAFAPERRTARFRTVCVACFPDGAESARRGRARRPHHRGAARRTRASATTRCSRSRGSGARSRSSSPEEKNGISHRARAAAAAGCQARSTQALRPARRGAIRVSEGREVRPAVRAAPVAADPGPPA